MEHCNENNNLENWDTERSDWNTSNDDLEIVSITQTKTIDQRLTDIRYGIIDNANVMDELKELYAIARSKEDKIKISKTALYFFKTLIRHYELTGDDKDEISEHEYGRIHSISQSISFWEKEQKTLTEKTLDFAPVKIC